LIWVWLLDAAAVTGVAFCAYAAWAYRGAYLPRFLDDQPIDASLRPVTIVVPARDEAENIGAAIASLLQQEAVDVRVVAVNDRSTDATGAILDACALRDPRLRVVHVRELPPGWLGKVHAMHVGLSEARTEWVLFTDGDVTFEARALARAVSHVERCRADHLAVLPRLDLHGFGERAVIAVFALLFGVRQEIGGVEDPKSNGHVGVGAFNLVRRSAWVDAGGFAPLRLEIADDVELGRRIKRRGYRQTISYAREAVRVRWQVGVGGFVAGLTKNAFAALGFRVGATLAAAALIVLFNTLAPLAVFSPTGWARIAGLAVWLFFAATYILQRRVTGTPPWLALLHPIAALAIPVVLLRSMAVTLRDGGVRWRDTFYPLDVLKAAQRVSDQP